MPEQNEPNWGHILGLGLQVAVGVVLGLVLGSWLDRNYLRPPWGVLVCTTLGFAGGMYLLIREALRANRD